MKKLLIGIGCLIVLLIVIALVAPFLIPTDTYRNQLVALVNQATGRTLTIAGPVKLPSCLRSKSRPTMSRSRTPRVPARPTW